MRDDGKASGWSLPATRRARCRARGAAPGLFCPRCDTGWWPGGAVARHSAWHQRLPALPLVGPRLPCPPGMGWPWSRCRPLRMGVACPQGLQQAGFCEKRICPHGVGGLQSTPALQQHCRGAGSLQIPHSGSAWPAPALAGGQQRASRTRSTHGSSPGGSQGVGGSWQPEQGGTRGRKPHQRGGAGGASASEPAPKARQASPPAVPEELSHQAGSAGTFLALLFSL